MQRTVPGRWCLVTGCQICPRNIVKVCVVLIIILICMILPYKILQFSAISTMCNALSPAVGVLSLVAKYAAGSVSQPSIHVYPELYVENVQQICTILGKGAKKKEEKKLTSVSFMYVCVDGNDEMLVLFSFFPQR